MARLFFLIMFVFTALVSYAQQYDPLQLAKKIFSKESFPDIKNYCTGEYDGHPTGNDLASNIKVEARLLSSDSRTSVVNILLSDTAGNETDTYLHLVYDNGTWKAKAFRALAMTGIIEEVHLQLKALTPQQVDSIIASPEKSYKLFKSKDDYRFELGNTGLVLASDNKLIAHFKKNRPAFEQLKNKLLLNPSLINKGVKSSKGEIYRQMRLLFIGNIRQNDESNGLNFLIGGMIDNSVGYLYIKNKKDVPDMSPENYIMIKEIGNGWYLYKTT